MKKKFRVGLIQMSSSSDQALMFKKSEKLVRQAAQKGARIICLPELFRAPYFPQYSHANAQIYAETIPGKSTRLFSRVAKDIGVVIIVPVYEKTPSGKYYNTAAVISEKGRLLGKYQKIHIPQDPGFYEKEYFEEGQGGYKIYKTKFATFSVLICYDQWYGEAAREARLMGADIIFYPSAVADIIGYTHPNDWHDAWETIQRGHAIANSVYVAAINRVGREGRMNFFGQSFVADPWGKILTKASSKRDEVLIQTLDLSYNKFLSEGWGFLRNRRPRTYKLAASNRLVQRTRNLKKVAHYEDEKKALNG